MWDFNSLPALILAFLLPSLACLLMALIVKESPGIIKFKPFKPEEPPQVTFQFFDRRRCMRTPCEMIVECKDLSRRLHGGVPFQVKLKDLSVKGCGLYTNSAIPENTLLSVKIRSGKSSYQHLGYLVRLHQTGEGYEGGVEFLQARAV